VTDIGTVHLIGAGPGDPGLITVLGRERLAQADVVLYDRLIGEALLELARPDAELVYVGKSAQQHRLSQGEINDLLVEKARAGLDVVRLKGGDPFVFGRGGEEAQALVAAGVSFEVVPGISSPIAVPAFAGIPVTHRDVASSFAVVTGHRRQGGQKAAEGLGLDWAALSRIDMLIVLMGVGNLPVIARELLAAGRAPETPAALVHWGTTPRQRTVVGTLATIAERVDEEGLRPPAVLVVGDVVGLRREYRLSWFENRPLFGVRVLITRPRDKAGETAARLRSLGAEPIRFPTIDIRPPEDWRALDAAIGRLSSQQYDWLIFTSTNGVRFLWQRLEETSRDARALAGARLAAIGPVTSEALANRGLRADLVPERYVAEAILDEIGPMEGQRVLLPRADIARPALSEGLRQAGARVDEIAAYRTIPVSSYHAHRIRDMLAAGEIDVLTFTSSSTVRNFVSALDPIPPLPEGSSWLALAPSQLRRRGSRGCPST
jgi:uroporphyrinogen III methyltransferase/synthase